VILTAIQRPQVNSGQHRARMGPELRNCWPAWARKLPRRPELRN